jgi:hypothetical protein
MAGDHEGSAVMNSRGPVFCKHVTSQRADAEVRGWQQIAPLLAAPALLGRSSLGNGHVVTYENIFGNGRCNLLFGDLIALSDRDFAALPRLLALIDGICQDLTRATAATGQTAPLAQCIPALYADRIRPGGRLDAWYLDADPTITIPAAHIDLTVSELAHHRLTVNGRPLRVDLPQIIAATRQTLTPGSRWPTAITQGDPTEPNIADPLCWLDFEHAGRNTLAGEAANLLWYLMGMGGWLVPRYQPITYHRTLRLALPPRTMPRIERLRASTRNRIDIRYTWNVGAGRHAAFTRARRWLAPHPGWFLHRTRAFLTMRILGIIPPSQLSGEDLLLTLIKAAECHTPGMTATVLNTIPEPSPHVLTRS